MSTPGTSPRRPPTAARCEPGTATRRCSAGSASVRSGSPASPSSHDRASYAAARRRPRYTCTWGAPTHGSSGPTTARRYTRRPATPARGQSPVGGLVALRRRRMDGSLLLRTGARGRGGAAPRHNPLRPAGRDLCARFPTPHAPAGGLRMGASQPPAGATPPQAPKRGGPGTPMAHCGGGRPPSPSPAP